MAKKILLIGGAGFIGTHLAKRLLEKGYQVVVVDKKEGIDADNEKVIREIFEKEKPEIVYHLAGAIDLKRGGEDSGIERAKIICQCSKEYDVRKLIFFSSGAAIHFNPESEYGKANLEIERIIEEAGLPNWIILRLGNVYGPGQWKSGIIPQIILNKDLKIKGDGSQTRSFIYIDDVVEAAVLAIETKKTGIYNVDGEEERTLNQIIDLIKTLTASVLRSSEEIKVSYEGEKDISAKALDIGKTKKDFNWKPKTDLKQGLFKTISYFKGHP